MPGSASAKWYTSQVGTYELHVPESSLILKYMYVYIKLTKRENQNQSNESKE
jgi:hypothetical protein